MLDGNKNIMRGTLNDSVMGVGMKNFLRDNVSYIAERYIE